MKITRKQVKKYPYLKQVNKLPKEVEKVVREELLCKCGNSKLPESEFCKDCV